jgi:hypothetical protein
MPRAARPKPRALRIPKAKRDRFLELIREGKLRPAAAAEVGETGTRFRSLCRHSPAFAEQYQQAVTAGRPALVESLRGELLRRALDDPSRMGDRALHQALILYDDEYRDKQQHQRLEHTGPMGGPMEVNLDDRGRLDLGAKLDRILELARETPGVPASSNGHRNGGAD